MLSEMKKGDILLTLGAGDVWKLGEKVLERLHAD
jgi:UDP-N-acetylmuramate-alanine ligase